ncbi:hypothetical protein IFM12276_14050 [Nocardia sputorum]|uniref:Uncharacterized protein n=1 Tax=Nocardia sputorum TaxID=2984338 RepID=A0ABN6TZQ7_9NOCA|nr:hypothetical protein IFM12276_14050 [Nocardia sputorum]
MRNVECDDNLLLDSTRTRNPRRKSDADQQVEVVVVRDPDGPVDVHIFIGGVQTSATVLTIDAGAGWCWADWKHCRDRNLSAASPSARRTMLAAYADPPGGGYVVDRGEVQWLNGVSTTPTTEEDQGWYGTD